MTPCFERVADWRTGGAAAPTEPVGATLAGVCRVVAIGAACVFLAGCAASEAPTSSSEQNSVPSSTPIDAVSPGEIGDDLESSGVVPSSTSAGDIDWEQVGGELVEMARLDQEERADFGDPDLEPFNDESRTGRLIVIVDRYGWPTPQMAGEDANRAAFLLAQHSDSDPAFQDHVLSLIQTSEDYAGRGEQEATAVVRIADPMRRWRTHLVSRPRPARSCR